MTERQLAIRLRVVRRLQQRLVSMCWSAWRGHVEDAQACRLEVLRVKTRTVFERLERTLLTRGWYTYPRRPLVSLTWTSISNVNTASN